jgi:catechol 2,3-dioxygenase-like lactoylglutathione lyase family enzyme
MIDHVILTVSDFKRSVAFYGSVITHRPEIKRNVFSLRDRRRGVGLLRPLT